ncbi:LUD domain-containing protein [Sphingobacterium sp. LRF_L2]|uniref:LUD domain-containing protein n=1 Tax=Sphingobacterium sp. LRF_L2 TaxID=3369421 RepID=UPI003F5DCCFD
MAQKLAEKFREESAVNSFDQQHRDIINSSIEKYQLAFKKAKSKFFNLENSKRKAHLIKWKTLENLDRYLLDFEMNFTRRGGKVIWANDIEEAHVEIEKIVDALQVKTVTTTKSSTIDEIQLNRLFQKKGIENTQIDLGQLILELAGQKSPHFTNPTIQLSLEEITKLFHEKFGTPAEASPEVLIEFSRDLLLNKSQAAEMCITGADFLIADTGSIALSENEGNAYRMTSIAKVHVAVVGIEQIIPNINDLDLFWPLLASHETGQNLTVYNNILNGPRKNTEPDGLEDTIVILLDNGRTNLLADKDQRQGLYCMRCGACLNTCPVYQNIGGQAYHTDYQGPIGAVTAPYKRGFKEYIHLSFASPLCGSATEICPMGIDLRKMTLLNRKSAVDKNLISAREKRIWKRFNFVFQRRSILDLFGGKLKNFLLRYFFGKAWGKHREMPKVADKSFSKQWKEQEKNRS